MHNNSTRSLPRCLGYSSVWRHRDSHNYKMMRWRVLGFLVGCAVSSYVLAQEGEWSTPALCAHDRTVSCLKRNFDSMQQKNQLLFWEIVRASAHGAMKCQSRDRVVDFLSLAKFGRGNAEFEEFLSENFEQLAVQQGGCLLDALTICDDDTKYSVVRMLANPMFVGPDKIDHLFDSAIPKRKYRSLTELYFASPRAKNKDDGP